MHVHRPPCFLSLLVVVYVLPFLFSPPSLSHTHTHSLPIHNNMSICICLCFVLAVFFCLIHLRFRCFCLILLGHSLLPLTRSCSRAQCIADSQPWRCYSDLTLWLAALRTRVSALMQQLTAAKSPVSTAHTTSLECCLGVSMGP